MYCFNNYSNPFTVTVVVLLFALIYDISIKNKIKKIFACFSKISLEMYLGLLIADYFIGPLREKSEYWLLNNDLSYILSYFVWVLGELMITFLLATIIHYAIKLLSVILKKINIKR